MTLIPFRKRQKTFSKRQKPLSIWILAYCLLLASTAIFILLQDETHTLAKPGLPEWTEVYSVYDGDTLTVLLPDGGFFPAKEKIRLLGIDTAELKGARCQKERTLATAQRDLLRQLVTDKVRIEPEGRDKYGRLLAVIYNEQHENVNEAMIRQGHARRYYGGYRDGWCA